MACQGTPPNPGRSDALGSEHADAAVFPAEDAREPSAADAEQLPDARALADAAEPEDASQSAPDAVVAPDASPLRLAVVAAPAGPIYAAGTFNAWNPADPAAQLSPDGDGGWALELPSVTPGASIELKLTRGSWSSVEAALDGRDRPNRTLRFDPAFPTAALIVERWLDGPAPADTRRGAVSVLPSVVIPQLSTTRNIWVRLPRGYDRSTARYPVVYLFDGQNLFDQGTASFGQEWRVDETLLLLEAEGRVPGLIVVGVESGPDRPCEYSVFPEDPHPNCPAGTAQGALTLQFLAETLKPLIDQRYRTLADRLHTAIGGSSMGASMALAAALRRPDLYSKVAALSPSYQNGLTHTLRMADWVRANPPSAPLRVHQDLGDAEQIRDLPNDLLTRNMLAVQRALEEVGVRDERALIVPGGHHDEASWSSRFGEICAWLWRP